MSKNKLHCIYRDKTELAPTFNIGVMPSEKEKLDSLLIFLYTNFPAGTVEFLMEELAKKIAENVYFISDREFKTVLLDSLIELEEDAYTRSLLQKNRGK